MEVVNSSHNKALNIPIMTRSRKSLLNPLTRLRFPDEEPLKTTSTEYLPAKPNDENIDTRNYSTLNLSKNSEELDIMISKLSPQSLMAFKNENTKNSAAIISKLSKNDLGRDIINSEIEKKKDEVGAKKSKIPIMTKKSTQRFATSLGLNGGISDAEPSTPPRRILEPVQTPIVTPSRSHLQNLISSITKQFSILESVKSQTKSAKRRDIQTPFVQKVGNLRNRFLQFRQVKNLDDEFVGEETEFEYEPVEEDMSPQEQSFIRLNFMESIKFIMVLIFVIALSAVSFKMSSSFADLGFNNSVLYINPRNMANHYIVMLSDVSSRLTDKYILLKKSVQPSLHYDFYKNVINSAKHQCVEFAEAATFYSQENFIFPIEHMSRESLLIVTDTLEKVFEHFSIFIDALHGSTLSLLNQTKFNLMTANLVINKYLSMIIEDINNYIDATTYFIRLQCINILEFWNNFMEAVNDRISHLQNRSQALAFTIYDEKMIDHVLNFCSSYSNDFYLAAEAEVISLKLSINSQLMEMYKFVQFLHFYFNSECTNDADERNVSEIDQKNMLEALSDVEIAPNDSIVTTEINIFETVEVDTNTYTSNSPPELIAELNQMDYNVENCTVQESSISNGMVGTASLQNEDTAVLESSNSSQIADSETVQTVATAAVVIFASFFILILIAFYDTRSTLLEETDKDISNLLGDPSTPTSRHLEKESSGFDIFKIVDKENDIPQSVPRHNRKATAHRRLVRNLETPLRRSRRIRRMPGFEDM